MTRFLVAEIARRISVIKASDLAIELMACMYITRVSGLTTDLSLTLFTVARAGNFIRFTGRRHFAVIFFEYDLRTD